MQEEIKTVGQFFKNLISSFQEKKPTQFIETFKLLANKNLQFPPEKLKSFESLQSYKQNNKDREVYEILDSIRLWAMTRVQSDKEKVNGFKHYLNILNQGLKYLDEVKEGGQWFVGCIKTLILFSKRAFMEAKAAAQKTGESSQKILENFFQHLRYYKSSRSMDSQTKKEFSLLIQTLQVSIYLRMHNYTKCERGLQLVKRDLHLYKPEDLNLFYFQYGKICLINHKFKESQEYLEKITIRTESQKRLILRYLIPCKVFLGKMCISNDFPEYLQLTKGIISGNFKLFDQSMEKYQKVWIKRGLYLLMQKMRTLVWRNFLKRVNSILQTNKILVQNIVKAVALMGGSEGSNQCVCIISNLILEGYIKGYIFCGQSKVLVLKNEGAFVPLSRVAG